MKKTALFTIGLIAGVVLSRSWRTLAKEGIKVGIQTGRKVREFSQQAMEDIEDIAAEAAEEVAEPVATTSGDGMTG